MKNVKELAQKLETKIQNSYEEGISLEEAEKLSGEFLHAQMRISSALKDADLNARMRKAGMKALRAALYLEAANKGDKKPTEATLSAIIDSNEIVAQQQEALDIAEVERDELSRFNEIFTQAHVYYRQMAKGTLG